MCFLCDRSMRRPRCALRKRLRMDANRPIVLGGEGGLLPGSDKPAFVLRINLDKTGRICLCGWIQKHRI